MRAALSASPSDHTAAPSSTTSFSRNCPGTTDSAGKPPRLGSQPGVEKRKLSVVRNIITAIPLPTAAIREDTGRSVLTLSDDFKVPDTPDPHWQVVDSKGRTYLLQRLPVKGDKVNRSIVVPAYVPDVA